MKEKSFKQIKAERLKDFGCCELCGRKYALELHHIIPKSMGGKDEDENLILVCTSCHSRLTPKGALTRNGKDKEKAKSYLSYYLPKKYYEICNQLVDGGCHDRVVFAEGFDELIRTELINFENANSLDYFQNYKKYQQCTKKAKETVR